MLDIGEAALADELANCFSLCLTSETEPVAYDNLMTGFDFLSVLSWFGYDLDKACKATVLEHIVHLRFQLL